MAINGINFANINYGSPAAVSGVQTGASRQGGSAGPAGTIRGQQSYTGLDEVRAQAQNSRFSALRPQHSNCSLCLDA